VHVSPPSARITVDGIEADGNPVRGRYPSGKTHRIAASAVGYLPKTQEVALPGDVDISLSLEKSEAPLPATRLRAAGHPADHNDRRAAPRAEPTHPIGASPSRTSASREKAASEPAALVDPKGGTNRVHPIQTTSPYDAQ
jgi:hypothetical protein